MGKHAKLGKQRKDKFYKLAKETGFRSRASFKLLQLNRKFEFLQKSRVLIDLCAAPGGWLQVAQQSMPVSAIIIGVDLVPIKPIQNVITLQEDITTEKCKQSIKKQIKTWKADVVLNDGAPNVGKSWVQDAFSQAELTLSALKLATEFLMPGGWFITKVFRSKDYNSLLWVFKKLFKKVHVTKPQASRNESAEIFVVCQGYIAPDKIDPKFLDSAHLFKDIDAKFDLKKSLLEPPKKKKAEGYEDGDKSVFFQLNASDFIFNDNHMELLAQCTEILFDDLDIKNHRTTTDEIKEYCKDVKILGKREIRALLIWRKKLRESIKEFEKKEKADSNVGKETEDIEEVEIENAENEAQDLELSKYQELKRKKKKVLKAKRKLAERINLKMIIKDDEPIIQEDRELFTIKMVKNEKDLEKLEDEQELEFGEDENIENTDGDIYRPYRSLYTKYNRYSNNVSDPREGEIQPEEDSSDSEVDEDLAFETIQNDESDAEDDLSDTSIYESESKHPLLVNVATKDERVNDAVSKWFDKDDFEGLDEEDDLDLELLTENIVKKKAAKENAESHEKPRKPKGILKSSNKKEESDFGEGDKDGNEEDQVVPEEQPKKKKKKVKLDPEGLALGSLMIRSKKTKRDIIDSSYNRYASNDVNLPDWFVKDEEKHNRKQLPVTAEMVEEYKAQLREINARPIKKVIEAKARKKRRALKRMDKARKLAEAVTENTDMSEKEKIEQLKSIYKKALMKKDTNVTYVVAKKGMSKKVRRPPGVKGRYKLVDKRLKKDDRKRKNELKSQKKPKRFKQKSRKSTK